MNLEREIISPPWRGRDMRSLGTSTKCEHEPRFRLCCRKRMFTLRIPPPPPPPPPEMSHLDSSLPTPRRVSRGVRLWLESKSLPKDTPLTSFGGACNLPLTLPWFPSVSLSAETFEFVRLLAHSRSHAALVRSPCHSLTLRSVTFSPTFLLHPPLSTT